MIFAWKVNLINLSHKSLKKLTVYLDLDDIMYDKLLRYLYKECIDDCDIRMLECHVSFSISNISLVKFNYCRKRMFDKDNTVKLLFDIDSSCVGVESVLIPNRKGHYTLCVSSQSGCVLHCSFCSTGNLGFHKNLLHSEIVSQVLVAKNILNRVFKSKVITNIVFMGMGEPLFNLNNLIVSIETLSHHACLGISKNKITVSSSGVSDNFEILKKNDIRLALSLHATSDTLRTKLMSINKKSNIKVLLNKCLIFKKRDRLTIEYLMLKNINDSIDDAKNLVKLLQNIECKVCLIPFNKFDGIKYEPSSSFSMKYFKMLLNANNITATIRKSMGVDIYGACGQLSGKK